MQFKCSFYLYGFKIYFYLYSSNIYLSIYNCVKEAEAAFLHSFQPKFSCLSTNSLRQSMEEGHFLDILLVGF